MFRALLLLAGGFVLIACASRDGESRDDEEQALGVADVTASAIACQARFAALGDPAVTAASIPVREVCRPGEGNRFLPFVMNELSALWGTVPAKLCTWQPGDPSSVCHPSVTPAGNAFYCAIDDSMAYDVTLLETIERKHGRFAVAATLAHEWGHLNQGRLRLMPVEPPVRYMIQNELSADCQAGMFTALEAILNRPITESDAARAFRFFCEGGDSRPWFDDSAHGSCEQRTQAFTRGYKAMLEYGTLLCAPNGADGAGRPTGIRAALRLCEP